MTPPIPPICLHDAERPEALKAAVAELRQGLHEIEDYAIAMQRARLEVDPFSDHPRYEGHRQREGAIRRIIGEIQERITYLLTALTNLRDDATRCASELAAELAAEQAPNEESADAE